jgi:hypothetical protein
MLQILKQLQNVFSGKNFFLAFYLFILNFTNPCIFLSLNIGPAWYIFYG